MRSKIPVRSIRKRIFPRRPRPQGRALDTARFGHLIGVHGHAHDPDAAREALTFIAECFGEESRLHPVLALYFSRACWAVQDGGDASLAFDLCESGGMHERLHDSEYQRSVEARSARTSRLLSYLVDAVREPVVLEFERRVTTCIGARRFGWVSHLTFHPGGVQSVLHRLHRNEQARQSPQPEWVARYECGVVADVVSVGARVPPVLVDLFVPRLRQIAAGVDPKVALMVATRGRPRKPLPAAALALLEVELQLAAGRMYSDARDDGFDRGGALELVAKSILGAAAMAATEDREIEETFARWNDPRHRIDPKSHLNHIRVKARPPLTHGATPDRWADSETRKRLRERRQEHRGVLERLDATPMFAEL